MIKKVLGMLVLASMMLITGCSKEKKCDCVTKIYSNPPIVGDHILRVIEDGECSDLNETTQSEIGRVETRCREVPMSTQYVIDGGFISY